MIVGGTCYARAFWTRPEVLEAVGAIAGLIVVAIMLVAFPPTWANRYRTARSATLSA